MLGYILGLVTVSRGLGYLGFRVISRLGLARFAYGLVGFWVFQGLGVGLGLGLRVWRLGYILGLVSLVWGLGFLGV